MSARRFATSHQCANSNSLLFSSNHNTCFQSTTSEVSCLQNNMCLFIVRPCKGQSQPMNIYGRSNIKYLIFFPLFDVDDPSSTLLYVYLNINLLSYASHISFNACQQVYESEAMDV